MKKKYHQICVLKVLLADTLMFNFNSLYNPCSAGPALHCKVYPLEIINHI